MKALKTALKILVILAAAGVLFVAGLRLFVILSVDPEIREPREGEHYDAIIVLGAAAWNQEPSPALKYRLEKAYALWKTGVADKIIVTGDHQPGDYDEVDVMYDYLAYDAHRVPEDKIERDYKGCSTYESMYRLSHYFGIESAIVVTQEYHLYRALYTGKYYGLKLCGTAAERALSWEQALAQDLREWPACVKDVGLCLIKKEIAE